MDSPPTNLSVILDMKYETNRLKSFEKGWPVPFIKAEDCAQIGLFYLGEEDKTRCIFCHVIIANWKTGDVPLRKHVGQSPMCSFLIGINVGNIPLSNDESWRTRHSYPERPHIIFNFQKQTKYLSEPGIRPTKYPEMSQFDKRLTTFHNFPNIQGITNSDFAEGGLFYSGTQDILQCFCCGGQMGSWNSTDKVWVEHAKHFPCCAFVKSIKGSAFIEQARSDYLLSTASIQQEPKENENVVDENSLEDKFECKICLEMKTRVVIVPCGHSLTCPSCIKKLKECPLCRGAIQSTVRLFFD